MFHLWIKQMDINHKPSHDPLGLKWIAARPHFPIAHHFVARVHFFPTQIQHSKPYTRDKRMISFHRFYASMVDSVSQTTVSIS